jgi:drug/metabolite transporter (DMT)-like permease
MSTKKEVIIGTSLSLCAALAYGISQLLIRSGMTDLNTPPLVGSALSLLAGTIVFSFLVLRDRGTKLRQEKRSVGFMLMAGIFAGSGIIANFFALGMSPVTTVSPLTSINPLFALLLSFLFLGQLERITPRVVLGTMFIVVGVTLITTNA